MPIPLYHWWNSISCSRNRYQKGPDAKEKQDKAQKNWLKEPKRCNKTLRATRERTRKCE